MTGLETMIGGRGPRLCDPSGACGMSEIEGTTGTWGTRGRGRVTGMTGAETGVAWAEKGPPYSRRHGTVEADRLGGVAAGHLAVVAAAG